MSVDIALDLETVVHQRFGGVGFHLFPELKASPQQAARERYWQQLAPSFARLNHKQRWERRELAAFADHLHRLKETATEIYLTTWDPADVEPGQPLRDYAAHIAEQLAYIVLERECDHVRTYCMTNELTLGKWGTLRWDLPRFAAYHRAIRRALDERGLQRIELLASDASPHASWGSLDWCMQHMDDITGVYGAHHYFNEHPADDPGLYPWFYQQCRAAAEAARAKGKDFIIGEFGAGQNQGQLERPGAQLDVCRYFDTPAEPMAALQVADGVIAMINAGVYGCGYWTFADAADPVPPAKYWNQWGILMERDGQVVPRSIYGAVGLMARHFRGPAQVVHTTSTDPLVHVAAVRRARDWSMAIVNRHPTSMQLRITVPAELQGVLSEYVYRPASLQPGPADPAGLGEAAATHPVTGGSLSISIASKSLVVLTS